MPGANLPGVARIVREYCEELQVPYTVAMPAQSYAPVISHLNMVGLSVCFVNFKSAIKALRIRPPGLVFLPCWRLAYFIRAFLTR